MVAIADLRGALGERPLTNDTPNGRVLLEVVWIEQEIKRQRLPIPAIRALQDEMDNASSAISRYAEDKLRPASGQGGHVWRRCTAVERRRA